jgi:hypothetical protein
MAARPPFSLPPPFDPVGDTQTWANVKSIDADGNSHSARITSVGPVFHFQNSDGTQSFIFSPNYTVQLDSHGKFLSLVYTPQPQKNRIFLYFESPEQTPSFMDAYVKSTSDFMDMSLSSAAFGPGRFSHQDEVVAVVPNLKKSKKVVRHDLVPWTARLFVDRGAYSFAAGPAEKGSKGRSKSKAAEGTVLVSLGDVTFGAEIPRELPPECTGPDPCSRAFRFYWNENKQTRREFLALAPTVQSALLFVMMAHVGGARSRAKPHAARAGTVGPALAPARATIAPGPAPAPAGATAAPAPAPARATAAPAPAPTPAPAAATVSASASADPPRLMRTFQSQVGLPAPVLPPSDARSRSQSKDKRDQKKPASAPPPPPAPVERPPPAPAPAPVIATDFQITAIPVAEPTPAQVSEVQLEFDVGIAPTRWEEIESAERARQEEAEKTLRRLARNRSRTIHRPPTLETLNAKPRETFLPNGPTVGLVQARYANLRKPRPVPEFAAPTLASLGVSSVPPAGFDAQVTARQLELAARYLPEESEPGGPLPATAAIVTEALKKLDKAGQTNYDFYDLSLTSRARREAFFTAERPVIDFETAMIELQGPFMQKDKGTLYSGDREAVELARLFAALMLNGLKDATALLSAVRALRIPALQPVLADAEGAPDPYAQASLIAIALLNRSIFISFLRQVRRRQQRFIQHYRASALVASAGTLQLAIDLLRQVALRGLDFALDVVPDLVARWGSEMIDKFIVTPAFAYLDIEDCKTAEELVEELVRQLGIGLRPKGRFHIQKGFLQAVAVQTMAVERTDWETFVNAVKKFPTVEQLFAEGLRRGSLHTWLMMVVMSDPVDQYYYPYASIADPFRAKFLVDTTVRILNQA